MTQKRKLNASGDVPSKKQILHAPESAPLSTKLAELQALLSTALQNPSEALECLAAIRDNARDAHAVAVKSSQAALEQATKDAKNEVLNGHESFHKRDITFPALPTIRNASLEDAVFTHQSTVPAFVNQSHKLSYERYEFLGDAYIEMMATRLLWGLFDHLSTGSLSKLRESLVNNQTLGEFSVRYGFDKRLRLTQQVTSNAKAMTKVKGDVFEAYIAALIVDDPVTGYERAEGWLHQLWLPILQKADHTAAPSLSAKEELLRKIGGSAIKVNYVDEQVISNKGAGIQTYFIGVYLDGWGYDNQHLGSGTGLNKRVAGNEAASAALKNHPLIDEIIAKKKVFDETVKREREKSKGNPS